MTKRHTNGQFARQPELAGVKLLMITTLLALTAWIYGNIKAMPAEAVELLSPLGDTLVQIEGGGEVQASPTPLPTAGMNTDALIDYYATKYTSSPNTQAHRKALLHCLYWKETRGGIDADVHGDNGLAGGPFQFHEPTYKSMRNKMIKEGVATELGSRYNFENAVDTTSWAISQGQGKQWGPILRGECQ